MPGNSSFSECDDCGKQYPTPRFVVAHQRHRCIGTKRTFRAVLEGAKEVWEARKRRRTMFQPHVSERRPSVASGGASAGSSPLNSLPKPTDCEVEGPQPSGSRGEAVQVSTSRSVQSSESPNATRLEAESAGPVAPQGTSHAQALRGDVSREIDLSRNITIMLPTSTWGSMPTHNVFNLLRLFYRRTAISHDPEATVGLSRVRRSTFAAVDPDPSRLPPQRLEIPSTSSATPEACRSLAPFSNITSFKLAEWFWTSGSRKSLKDFRLLVDIISDPSFSIPDVASANWTNLFSDLSSPRTNRAIGVPPDPGEDDDSEWQDDDRWIETPIQIEVPFHRQMKNSGMEAHVAGTLHHRDILAILEQVISQPEEFHSLHFHPFRRMWKPNASTPPVSVYDELYTSDSFIQVDRELQDSPPNPSDSPDVERVVIALMFWSDKTQLAPFGGAELWPLYMFIGNQSKWRRCKGSSNACHHIAFFESLSANFNEYLKVRGEGKMPTAPFMAYCQREMFHQQWKLILSDELVQAMECGFKLTCLDGIERRFFPRVFTYSADYPEKMLIATLRGINSACPCHRCFVKKGDLDAMGTQADWSTRTLSIRKDDRQRQHVIDDCQKIIRAGMAIDTDKIEILLSSTSMTPVENAFSRLNHLGFDIFAALTVDLMHEFELGVWKSLFTHLLRLLNASSSRAQTPIAELDSRFRNTPPYGSGTIRRFNTITSKMKRKAARDFEDLLQCAIPAFDGLLNEPHNTIVMDLLYLCAEWHSLAKLRMHTEHTLRLLEDTTILLAAQFRRFKTETCDAFQTVELDNEVESRIRAQARSASKSETTPSSNGTPGEAPPSSSDRCATLAAVSTASSRPRSPSLQESIPNPLQNAPPSVPTHPSSSPSGILESVDSPSNGADAPKAQGSGSKARKKKVFNINTIKYHVLWDYPASIRRSGTCDSFTSEIGEFAHQQPKDWFKRTDKRNFRRQIGKIERRRARLRAIRSQISRQSAISTSASTRPTNSSPHVDTYTDDRSAEAPLTQVSQGYHMAVNRNLPIELSLWMTNGSGIQDPALLTFIPDLKRFLLPKLLDIISENDPTPCSSRSNYPGGSEDSPGPNWQSVVFANNRIFSHKLLRLEYTTYDAREGTDIVHVDTHQSNIMVLDSGFNASHPNPVGSMGPAERRGGHPFRYGKVLGIYHADVSYIGILPGGRRDMTPYHVEFLWVRWYRYLGRQSAYSLDRVDFPPMASPASFGFLDPRDALQAVQIIPHFALGKLRESSIAISALANDSDPYKAYYVNRFVDRDMSMRYRWGLAVGHQYARSSDDQYLLPDPIPIPDLETNSRGRNPPGSNDIVINSSNPPAGTVAPNWNTTSDREYALVDSDDDSSSESESEGGE